MANTVEIANIALQMIGEPAITSFDENTSAARLAQVRFPTARDAVLRDHPWNFAKRRQRLAQLADPPAFGWEHQYALPSDWLRTLKVFTQSAFHHQGSAAQLRYQIEGRRLLADADEVFLVYIARVTNTEEWDALATEALAARLAAELAVALTDSRQFAAQLRDDYQEKIQRARGVDAKDEPADVIEANEWLVSRFGHGSHLVGEARPIEDPE